MGFYLAVLEVLDEHHYQHGERRGSHSQTGNPRILFIFCNLCLPFLELLSIFFVLVLWFSIYNLPLPVRFELFCSQMMLPIMNSAINNQKALHSTFMFSTSKASMHHYFLSQKFPKCLVECNFKKPPMKADDVHVIKVINSCRSDAVVVLLLHFVGHWAKVFCCFRRLF